MKKIALSKSMFATVSDEDYHELVKYKWTYNRYGYAARSEHDGGKRKYITMHRQIMQTPDGMDTDHINHDRLDNRRENLRICTRAQNITNSTRTNRGATFLKDTGKWMCRITVEGKTKFLGNFMTREEALRAYDRAALNYHGEYASLNYGR